MFISFASLYLSKHRWSLISIRNQDCLPAYKVSQGYPRHLLKKMDCDQLYYPLSSAVLQFLYQQVILYVSYLIIKYSHPHSTVKLKLHTRTETEQFRLYSSVLKVCFNTLRLELITANRTEFGNISSK